MKNTICTPVKLGSRGTNNVMSHLMSHSNTQPEAGAPHTMESTTIEKFDKLAVGDVFRFVFSKNVFDKNGRKIDAATLSRYYWVTKISNDVTNYDSIYGPKRLGMKRVDADMRVIIDKQLTAKKK